MRQSMYRYYSGFTVAGGEKFRLALERGEGEIKVFETEIRPSGTSERLRFAERVFKTMLWCYGGYKAYIYNDGEIAEGLRKMYSEGGERAFDAQFMRDVYKRELEFVNVKDGEAFPKNCEKPYKAGGAPTGNRIGFDAGGSDRKVTAAVDGKVIYEEEVVWHPKLHADITYHEENIRDGINTALRKLGGRADAIGVSTAGIVVDNEVRVASLFRKVPKCDYDRVLNIYKNLGSEYNCPVKVVNDGDAAALAGAFQTKSGRILGIAMGTSLAGGYIGCDTDIKGYLNELAFIPVDAAEDSPVDEWSGDKGTGTSYLSQDAVIRLACGCGIDLNEAVSPAEKLKIVQKLAEKEDGRALKIFEDVGVFLAETLLYLKHFYDFNKVILLGRVVSGKGGALILSNAEKRLQEENGDAELILPDEMSRRLGQSYTAIYL